MMKSWKKRARWIKLKIRESEQRERNEVKGEKQRKKRWDKEAGEMERESDEEQRKLNWMEKKKVKSYSFLSVPTFLLCSPYHLS